MNKEKMIEIIEENSYIKYCICELINLIRLNNNNISHNDILDYLEQVLGEYKPKKNIIGGKNERNKRKYSDFK